MKTVKAFASAKLNLTLHVTGQRADGFHMLDSLVLFASIGDWIRVTPSRKIALTVNGPFAHQVPTGPENLVCQAAALIGASAHITLEKNLPVASGIGGGSSDAAATLRALSELTNRPLPAADDILKLGADIPVCMTTGLVRMRGIGEDLDLMGPSPRLSLLLVNPMVSVATESVFSNLACKTNLAMAFPMPDPTERDIWVGWLAEQNNDLEASAIDIAPEIAAVLDQLRRTTGCLFARMSGSGATCFAIMKTDADRDAARSFLQDANPGWWVAAGTTGGPAPV